MRIYSFIKLLNNYYAAKAIHMHITQKAQTAIISFAICGEREKKNAKTKQQLYLFMRMIIAFAGA